MDINKYQEISADIWKLFKKYHSDEAQVFEFPKDAHELHVKYEADEEALKFMQRLLKVYFDELTKTKGWLDERAN